MGFEPWVEAALFGLVGLMIGSFLNVVIHRLPRMMERQWAAVRGRTHPTSETNSRR